MSTTLDLDQAADLLELERLRPIPSQTRMSSSCGPDCHWSEGKVRHCGCSDCHGRPR